MAGQGFQLAQHPWLSLIIVMLAEVVGQVLVRIVVIGLLKRPGDAPLTQFTVSLLGHAIVLFLLVPFVLKLPDGTRSFSAYLDAIRLSRVQTQLGEFLAHLQSGHPKPASGLGLVAIRQFKRLPKEFWLHILDHPRIRILQISSLCTCQQLRDVGCMRLLLLGQRTTCLAQRLPDMFRPDGKRTGRQK